MKLTEAEMAAGAAACLGWDPRMCCSWPSPVPLDDLSMDLEVAGVSASRKKNQDGGAIFRQQGIRAPKMAWLNP